MAHVFISYTYLDSDFASSLIRNLNSAGIETADCIPLRKREGFSALDEALDAAFVLVLIVTPEALADNSIMYEWAYALGGKKPILPVMLKQADLPERLKGMQALDFINFDTRPWNALIDHIHHIRGEYGSSIIAIPRETPTAIRNAILEIDSKTLDERKAALDKLAKTEHPTALAALTAALHHHLPDTRIYAALRLAERTRYRDERALAGLLEALDAEDADVQLEATTALGKLGDSAAAGLLVEVTDNSADVRKSVVEGLVQALKATHKDVRQQAALRLGEIGDSAALPALKQALQDPLIGIRAAAALALGKIGDSAATPALVARLDDEIAYMRQSAADALGKIGDPGAVKPLAKLLADWSNDVRQAAATALGQIGDASAIQPLLDVLHDERMGARGAAARALAMIGEPALEGLVAELGNKDSHVRQYTATALGMIGDADAVPGLVKVLNDQAEVGFVRHAAAEALVDIGAAGVPGLVTCLQDPDPEMREIAADSLELIATPEAVAALDAWQKGEFSSEQ